MSMGGGRWCIEFIVEEFQNLPLLPLLIDYCQHHGLQFIGRILGLFGSVREVGESVQSIEINVGLRGGFLWGITQHHTLTPLYHD